MAKGTLYGVGVGPGDPKLMTIRAGEVIRAADVLAYPVNEQGEGRARSIAAPVIEGHAKELPVHLPMRVERPPAQEAYGTAAREIACHLDSGRDVAWLCVGDPMLYGSFMYLAARLPGYDIEIVPGVTSLTACAAQAHQPLAGRNDILSVIPATLDEDDISAALERANAAVIVKVGRHFAKVRKVLDELDLSGAATILEGVGGKHASIAKVCDIPSQDQSYFSSILVRREDVA